MDWSKQKKHKPKRKFNLPRPPAAGQQQHEAQAQRTRSRSRSNSFVLSKIFDETIEKESRKKNIPFDTHEGDGIGEDIIQLHDVEYEFGSEWLVKSPPRIKPSSLDQRERQRNKQAEKDDSLVQLQRKLLPPLPQSKSVKEESTKSTIGRPQKAKSVIARRISSLPKPIEQKSEASTQVQEVRETNPIEKQKSVQTQTEVVEERSASASGAGALASPRPAVPQEILHDIRLCNDLIQEMIGTACEVAEIYRKERKKTRRRQKQQCCVIS